MVTFVSGFLLAMWAENLRLSTRDDELYLTPAARSRFLSGRALQRLRDGNTVPFDFQITISSGSKVNITHRVVERFSFSYDLWEERFSVVRARSNRRAQRLTADEAEAWCWNELRMPLARLPRDKPLYVRVEIRAEDPGARPPLVGDPGVNLAALIEIFSRPAGRQQQSWTYEAGPLSFADLRAGS